MAEEGQSTEEAAPVVSTAPVLHPEAHPMPTEEFRGTPVEETNKGVTSLPYGSGSPIPTPMQVPQHEEELKAGDLAKEGPKPSRWEQYVSLPYQEASHESLIGFPGGEWGSLSRLMQEKWATPSGNTITADEANKWNPDREVPYTTDMDPKIVMMEKQDSDWVKNTNAWKNSRSTTRFGNTVGLGVGLVGGFTDPLNAAIGIMSGGVSELLAPGAPFAAKLATTYAGNVAGMTYAGAIGAGAEAAMGKKQKELGEIATEALLPAAAFTGLHYALAGLARVFKDKEGSSQVNVEKRVKEAVAALEQDKRPPDMREHDQAQAARQAGVTVPVQGQPPQVPTMITSPLQETQLYAAVHADGTPHTFKHGFGEGIQLTDRDTEANNAVAVSTDGNPGTIFRGNLPEGARLLDLDRPASEHPEVVSAIERSLIDHHRPEFKDRDGRIIEPDEVAAYKARNGETFYTNHTERGRYEGAGRVTAHDSQGNYIGEVAIGEDLHGGDNTKYANWRSVNEEWQRQGVSAALNDAAMKATQGRMRPSDILSNDAANFWRARHPQIWTDYVNRLARPWAERIAQEGPQGQAAFDSWKQWEIQQYGRHVGTADINSAVEAQVAGHDWAPNLEVQGHGATPFLPTLQNERLMDVVQHLHDMAGLEGMPADGPNIAQTALHEELGYHGYQFEGRGSDGIPNSRQVHMFSSDSTQLALEPHAVANPDIIPQVGSQQQAAIDARNAKDSTQSTMYAPGLDQMIHDLRHGKTFDPSSTEEMAKSQEVLQEAKDHLTELAETSPTARAALEKLRNEEAMDRRLVDIARRIAECGKGGGV